MEKIPTLDEVMQFARSHSILLGSTAAIGLSLFGLRRYCAGGKCTSSARLDGKTVIITGANTGIGKETAKDLAKRGAKVILACRDLTKAERAAQSIIQSSGNKNVLVRSLDLASLNSVRRFAKNIKDTEGRVDVLINNAGVMMCPQMKTEDGFEMQIGTNHLGHFLLTVELLDLLKASTPSRIVNVASEAHRNGQTQFDDINMEKNYSPSGAYGQSKLANILFTRELHRRLQGSGVTVYSLHPGVIRTELGRHLTAPHWRILLLLISVFMKSIPEGAQTTIYCAVTEGIEKDSGKYFSDCAVKKPRPQAEDDEAARKLWDLSEKLVGLNPKA